MPDVSVVNLKQKAVLWAYLGTDRYGQPKVQATAQATEIDCRWEQKVQERVNAEGTTIGYPITAFVDREIEVGSVMWKGEKANLPDPLVDLYEVVAYDEVPDIKGRNPVRTVVLDRYAGSLNT